MNIEDRLKILMNWLQKLVALLRLDSECQWLPKFQSDLEFCSRLVRDGYTKADVADLSNSITYVFQGMGSFNDYAPAKYDSKSGKYLPIPGTENYESVTKEVFDLARGLITHDWPFAAKTETSLMVHPFSGGGTHVTTSARLAAHAESATFGGADGLFLAPTRQIDELLASGASRSQIEIALGLNEGALAQGTLMRMDVANPFTRSLSLPTSGNMFFRPGKRTPFASSALHSCPKGDRPTGPNRVYVCEGASIQTSGVTQAGEVFIRVGASPSAPVALRAPYAKGGQTKKPT